MEIDSNENPTFDPLPLALQIPRAAKPSKIPRKANTQTSNPLSNITNRPSPPHVVVSTKTLRTDLSGHEPGPPDNGPANPAVAPSPHDKPSEGALANNRHPAIEPFAFCTLDLIEATRPRKIPRKTRPTIPSPLANVTNNPDYVRSSQNDQALWVQCVADLTQNLSTQLNSIQRLPEEPGLWHQLQTIQRILLESSESLATALRTPNTRHGSQQLPIQNSSEPILRAIRDLSERMEAHEAALSRDQSCPPTITKPACTRHKPLLRASHGLASPETKPCPNRPKLTFSVPKPQPSKAADPHSPVHPPRYIVRFKGNPPPPFADRLSSERATNRLNARFKDLPTAQNKLTVVAAHCKQTATALTM
jgi:hypothetical protein